jgi:O-antigen/teichoic acid export membrane protein
MPIISRIYPPEEFGRFQLMFSIVTSFAVISTFRYEMAIVLEDTKEDRDKLITLCLILLLITTSIFTLIFFFFGEEILSVLNAKELTPYIGFMSLMFLGYGLYELSRYSFISEKKFSSLAINNIK